MTSTLNMTDVNVYKRDNVKIKRWRSKGMSEKKNQYTMDFLCGLKNSSLGISVWYHPAKPHDAKQ